VIGQAGPPNRINPEVAAAYIVVRGRAYTGKRDYGRAIAAFEEAIKLDPKNVEAYSGRGNAYNGKGDYGRAIADYDRALKLNSNLAAARKDRDRAQAVLAARPEPAKPPAPLSGARINPR
jgi:tetratricopeptide (TPR) repeat protein